MEAIRALDSLGKRRFVRRQGLHRTLDEDGLAGHGRAAAGRRARRADRGAGDRRSAQYPASPEECWSPASTSATRRPRSQSRGYSPGASRHGCSSADARRPARRAQRTASTGIAELLARAERRLGARPELALLAELHPVQTDLLELGRIEELALERTAIARPASETPSGSGVGAGRLISLDGPRRPARRRGRDRGRGTEDFDAAAAQLRDARERGWRIAAAIVQGDDGVLIGNRFDRSLPIVDEVADAAQLPLGSARCRRGRAGRGPRSRRCPIRCVSGCCSGSTPTRRAPHAPRPGPSQDAERRSSFAPRAATQRAPRSATLRSSSSEADGSSSRSTSEPIRPRRARSPRSAVRPANRSRLLDVVWRSLPSPPDDPGLRAQAARRRRAIAIALLAAGRERRPGHGAVRAVPERGASRRP